MTFLKYKIHYSSWLLTFYPARIKGVTIGSHIFLRAGKIVAPQWLINHEIIHVAQCKKHGFLGFLWQYFWTDRHYPYRQKPFEVEAFKNQFRDIREYLLKEYNYTLVNKEKENELG